MKFTGHLPDIINWTDLYLAPLYLLLIFFITWLYIKKHYRNKSFKKYIFPALSLRIVGCIFLAMIMQFVYHEGDTFSYFTGGHEIFEAFSKSPKIAWEIVTNTPANYSAEASDFTRHMGYPGYAPSHLAMFKITGVVGILGFGQYIPIAFIYSFLSFIGTWLIFLVFAELYPALQKRIAITTLFIPSVIVWSTAILKEPLCMFGLGICFYSIYNILNRRHLFKYLLYFLFGAWVLLTLKDYIFYSFAVAALFWGYFTAIKKVHNSGAKKFIRVIIYLFIVSLIIYFFNDDNNFISQQFAGYFKKADFLQNAMVKINDESGGSAYTIATSDFSSWGILSSLLLSLNVSLFRPYLWECTNALMVLNFIESFITTILVLVLIKKLFIRKAKIKFTPLLTFCLVFTLLMAFMVGFISFNFGTLIRYKVPFQPFFYTAMIILISNNKIRDGQPDKEL